MSSTAPQADAEEMLRLRYGTSRTPRLLLVIGGLAGVVVAGLFAWIAWTVTNPPVQWKLLAWDVTSPTNVEVTYEVRRSPEATVTCVLRAQDSDHIDVGYAVVTLPADGTGYIQPRYPLTTLREAFAVEVLSCAVGTDVPPGAMVPQFGPGVTPPEQRPPGRAPVL